jgi:catechol 2,3-dioxygenase-like lactoylglutathione lyase family enzyme
MLRLGAVVLNVTDVGRARDFWTQALGHAPLAENGAFLVPSAPQEARLHLDEDDRTHLDLWVDSAEEQRAEVERLVGLGARRVAWQYPDDADFVVLADPVGTVFCVVDTSR